MFFMFFESFCDMGQFYENFAKQVRLILTFNLFITKGAKIKAFIGSLMKLSGLLGRHSKARA